MPQLIFKGVKREEVKKLSLTLPDLLSQITSTPRDYFTFERPSTEYFFDGESYKIYPLVEVVQFSRGTEIESKMAEIIQSEIKKIGYNECEVYFIHIEKQNYYE